MQAISSTRLGLALVVAAVGPAAAQPVTSPKTCAVTIARAPEDVRVVVEAWVRAEQRCSTALEVRIVPTEGGLYLFAQDEQGRVRERVVPDPQSAGVLIASWVADDTMYVPPPTATPGREMVMPGPVMGTESLTAPGPAPASSARSSKWIELSVGLSAQRSDDGGLRADVDLLAREHYSFGIAASATATRLPMITADGDGQISTSDKKLMVTAARTWQSGRWFLRGMAGAGAVYSRALSFPTWSASSAEIIEAHGWFPTAEAAAAAGIELGRDWALQFGPMLTMYSEQFKGDQVDPNPANYMYGPNGTNPVTLQRRNSELIMFTGLKYRL